MAANYSRRVEIASEKVNDAEKALLDTLREAYPFNARVCVRHHRGVYFGKVIGYDVRGRSLTVLNDKSGKGCKSGEGRFS